MIQDHRLREQFLESGIDQDAMKNITFVGNWFNDSVSETVCQEWFQQAAIPFLLPYCAKNVACKFRYADGCGRCGQCDIGEGFMLADEYGLEPITIQNYEMLEAKLETLKKSGCNVFIGTCCERFWTKHQQDFARIGLPGILINVDSTTCYVSGTEQKAYKGSFDRQVRLKNEFIRLVVDSIAKFANLQRK